MRQCNVFFPIDIVMHTGRFVKGILLHPKRYAFTV